MEIQKAIEFIISVIPPAMTKQENSRNITKITLQTVIVNSK
ncbi:hypothetical protein WL1483_1187 [Aeromonas schubertii]|uniref:Uncharacterized protein n=1 Tax=Aeromonas schubertii TaxID=652 RepID=A0A0S2SFY0_9GAMM|nr:hypothetical protein WL1483_1187 [Aeromonas schubertii]